MQVRTHQTSREIAVSVGWFTVGAMWFVQAFIPWTASGTLSRSSTIDASSLIRSGAVESLAPPVAGWLLLILPIVGLVMCATAFARVRAIEVLRPCALVLALGVSASLTHYLASFHISNFGPGALLAWLGCIAFVIVLVARQRTTTS